MVHTTVLNYMVMRILGVPRDEPVLQRARKILLEMGVWTDLFKFTILDISQSIILNHD